MPTSPLPALHQAVKQQQVAAVEALLAAGHDPNLLDASGEPPLWHVLPYAIGFVLEPSTERIIRALLDAGADPNLADVGSRLVREANAMVCSALENNHALAFAELLRQT